MKKLFIPLFILCSFFAKAQTLQRIIPQFAAPNPGSSHLDSIRYTYPGKYGGYDWLYNSATIRAYVATHGGGGTYTFTPPLSLTTSVVSIPQATNIVDGYFSHTDWILFNGKLSPNGNGSGLTSFTSSQITAALGFAPYSSTNPSGYISSFTETDPLVPAYSKSLTAFLVIKSSTDALYQVIGTYLTPTNTQPLSNKTLLPANIFQTPIGTGGTDSTVVKIGSTGKFGAIAANYYATSSSIVTYTASNGVIKTVNNFTSDTTYNRTVANSYSLAALQTKFNNYLLSATAASTYALQATTISPGYGMLGGGSLVANRTLSGDSTVFKSKAGFLTDYNNLSGRINTNNTAIGLKQPRVVGNKPSATGTTYATTDSVTQVLANLNSGVLANSASITALPAYTSSPTASTLMYRDANINTNINNLFLGYTTTVTSAGTTTLTVSSTNQQYFTGVTTQIVQLPVASTLALGQQFLLVNNSTGIITINSSGSNAVGTLGSGMSTIVTCILTSGTTAASWNISNNVYFSTATFSGAGTSVSPYVLITDASPTSSSTNPVQSGGVFTALALKAAFGSTQTWAALQTFGTNISIGGVTATGASGTGKVLFDQKPTITSPILKTSLTAINATATATAAQLAGGTLTSTSAAATTITLPTATAMATQISATQGTRFEFYIDNTAGANIVTIAVNTGITAISAVTGGTTLTVPIGQQGTFQLLFSSATVASLARIQ